MKYVHVAKGNVGTMGAADIAAASNQGKYDGVVHHDGQDCRAYKFEREEDAKAFHDKMKANKSPVHMENNESADEGGSFDPAITAVMTEAVKRDFDYYQAFTDVDEACEWAEGAADSATPFVVIFCEKYAELRAGPLDEIFTLATGCPDYEIVAKYGVDEVRPEIEEASTQRRAFGTRLNQKRKLHTTMDHKRRKIASNAKMWRLRNKSKTKGYTSVYTRPTGSALENAIVSVLSGRSVADVVNEMITQK